MMSHAVAQSQVKRGEEALEQNRLEAAIAAFKVALENEWNLPSAYRGLGMAYALQHNDELALQSYGRYLKLAPSASDAAEIRKAIDELKTRSKISEEK